MNFITKRIRQIFFMSKVQKRVIASVLTLCMVFGYMQLPGVSDEVRAAVDEFTPGTANILINGKEITNDTKIKNGDALSITYNYMIPDSDKSQTELTVDLSALACVNIELSTSGAADLTDVEGNKVGTYEIIDGTNGKELKIYITDPTFLERDERGVSIEIKGEVALNNSGLNDGAPVQVGFDTKVYNAVYDTGIPESRVDVAKSSAGGLYRQGSEFKQDFNLTMTARDGDAVIQGISDTSGAALKDMGKITVVSSGIAGLAGEYADVAALSAALSGKTLPKDQSVTISYTQTVDHAASGSNNKATVTYETNKGNDKSSSGEVWVNLNDPKISKTGSLSADKSQVTWTVTIDLGDYAIGDPNLAEVVKSIKDKPGAGMADVTEKDILAGMTGGPKVYTYTYTADVDPKYQTSLGDVTAKNDVEMTMTDDTVYKAEGKVTIPGTTTDWVSKAPGTYDAATKTLPWTVTLDVPAGVTNVTLADAANSPHASNLGSLTLMWPLEIDGVEVIDSNGQRTAAADMILGDFFIWGPAVEVKLKDSYVQSKAGGSITVNYYTKVNDAETSGKVYNNTINVKYTDPVLGTQQTQSASGQFKDQGNLLTKTGSAISGRDAIRYKLKLYMDGYVLTAGQKIEVKENFPANMKYDGAMAELKAAVEDRWNNVQSDCPVTAVFNGTDGFEIEVTQDLIDKLSSDYPYVTLSYTLEVDDRAEFVQNGTTAFTNNASASYDGQSLGTASVTVNLSPQKIVSKTGEYTESTAPYVNYQVDINKDRLDLLPGDGKLTATDRLGSCMSYKYNTIAVKQYNTATGSFEAITGYKFTYNMEENSIEFTDLPDGEYLRIEYQARVNLAAGERLTPENSTNAFSLGGSASDALNASKGFSMVALQQSGIAFSKFGSIELYKYWTDADNQMQLLPGAKFKLTRVKYDAATDSMVPNYGEPDDVYGGVAVLRDDIEVDADGIIKVDKLSYAYIYSLEETDAPTGFAKRMEPYYFVLAGNSAELPPETSAVKVSVYAPGAPLYYQNYKSDTSSLEVTKSVQGVDAADVADVLNHITFTVKQGGTVISGGTFKGSVMTLSGGVYKKTFADLAPGTYTVEESMTDAAGYIYKSTSYEVTVGEAAAVPGAGTSASAEVESGKMTVAAFENTYEKMAALKLSKTVTGDADWDDVKANIAFEIYEGSVGASNLVETIAGSELVSDGKAYSKEITGLDPSKIYVVKETGAGLTNYTKTTTYTIGSRTPTTVFTEEVTTDAITLTPDATETVAFENNYVIDKGNLKITKTITGDAGKTWDDVKDSLEFTVKNGVTGDIVCTVKGSDAGFMANGSVYEYTLPDDLPIGNYVVSETVTDISGVIISTSYEVDVAGTPGASATASVAAAEVVKDGMTVVAYTNDYKQKVATLVLRKTVTGALSWDQIKDDISFKVQGPDQNWTIAGSDMTPAGGGTYIKKIENITTEGTYVITESFAAENSDYTRTTTVKVDSGAAVQGNVATIDSFDVPQGATVWFTNDYKRDVGKLVLKKTIAGIGDADLGKAENTIRFVVTPSPDGNASGKTYMLSQFTKSAGGNYVLEFNNVPTGTYHVQEYAYDVSGYKTNDVSYELTAAAGTTSTVTNGKANGADASVSKDKTTTVAVTDEYQKLTGNLEITKKVNGLAWAEVASKLSFRVTNTETGYDKTVPGTQFTDDNGDGVYNYKIENLPLGTYHVTETLTDVNGYMSSTTYAVGAGSAVTGKDAELTISSQGQTAHVAYVNTYKALTGQLMIKKSVRGDRAWANVRDTLSFSVRKTDGTYERTVFASAFSGPDADGNYYYVLDGLTSGDYTLKEIVAGENTVDYTRTTTVKINDGAAVSGLSTDFMFDNATGASATITNEYTRNNGSLVLKKTIADIEPADLVKAKNAITFTITPSPDGTGSQKVYKLSQFTTNADGTYTLNLSDVPTGNYHVKETVYDVDGYDTESVEYTVTSGTTTSAVSNGQANGANAAVSQGKTTTISVTDDYKKQTGVLLITKTIKGDVTKEEAEGALQFKVTDTATGISKTYTLKEFRYDASSTATEKKYTLSLPQTIGVYEVEETVYDINGYVTASVKYSVNGSAQTSGTKAQAQVTNGATVNVDFEDSYTKPDTGKLVITKTIKGDVTKEEAEGALQFKVTNKDDGTSKVYTLKDFTKNTDGTYTLELKATTGGYTVEETIYDIKGYITASVKYSVNGGGQTSGTKADASVTKDQTTTVTFEDVYEKNEGTLILTKTVKGDLAWEDIKENLSFVVKNNKTGKSVTYKASEFKDDDGDGVYTLMIKGLERGEYTVTEKIEDVKGYLLETTYSVDGSSQAVGSEAKVTLTKDGAKADFVNQYTSTKGKLVITKTLKGKIDRKDAEAALKFKVTNTKTKKSKTYTLDDFKYDKDAERYVLELSKEPGTYKVEETAYDVEGYKIKSITYSIGDGERKEGTSAKAKVKTGETTKVAFIDKYYKTKTSDESSGDTPTSSTSGSATSGSATTSTTNRTTPKTGDEAPIALWIAMLLLGACGIGGGIYGMRKNRK